jgi:hypothetical protein
MLRKLLTHALSVWAGGFVVLYWMLDHVARELDASVTFNDIVFAASWPYTLVTYVWSLICQ